MGDLEWERMSGWRVPRSRGLLAAGSRSLRADAGKTSAVSRWSDTLTQRMLKLLSHSRPRLRSGRKDVVCRKIPLSCFPCCPKVTSYLLFTSIPIHSYAMLRTSVPPSQADCFCFQSNHTKTRAGRQQRRWLGDRSPRYSPTYVDMCTMVTGRPNEWSTLLLIV